MIALAFSLEHLLEICDIIVRLLAASVVHSVILQKWNSVDDCNWINTPTFSYLMENCQSLTALTLIGLEIDENHFRVLGALSRPGLEITLEYCRIPGTAAEALTEVLGCNQGPTKLAHCYIDYSVLADGLRGNSRLKSLTPGLSLSCDAILAIAGALKENKGLVDLKPRDGYRMDDEGWDVVCDYRKTHPTLEVLDLSSIDNDATTAPAVIASQVQALLGIV